MDLLRPHELRAIWLYWKEARQVSNKYNYKDNTKILPFQSFHAETPF